MDTTYRLVSLADPSQTGDTAATPELARLVPCGIDRSHRIGIERTDWIEHFEKMKVHRTILIEAENEPREWNLGVES